MGGSKVWPDNDGRRFSMVGRDFFGLIEGGTCIGGLGGGGGGYAGTIFMGYPDPGGPCTNAGRFGFW